MDGAFRFIAALPEDWLLAALVGEGSGGGDFVIGLVAHGILSRTQLRRVEAQEEGAGVFNIAFGEVELAGEAAVHCGRALSDAGTVGEVGADFAPDGGYFFHGLVRFLFSWFFLPAIFGSCGERFQVAVHFTLIFCDEIELSADRCFEIADTLIGAGLAAIEAGTNGGIEIADLGMKLDPLFGEAGAEFVDLFLGSELAVVVRSGGVGEFAADEEEEAEEVDQAKDREHDEGRDQSGVCQLDGSEEEHECH